MPKVKRREVKPYYICGDAMIYHADCRDVLPMLADGSVDFIFTDPPYGHANMDGDLNAMQYVMGVSGGAKNHYGETREAAIANDTKESTDPMVRWAFVEFNRLLVPGGCCCCCCCGGGGPDPQFARWSLWLDEAIGFKQMVIWDKGLPALGWHYRRVYETVLIAEKPGASCKWYGGERAVENVFGFKRVHKPEHPNTKPMDLPRTFIDLHSLPGDLVLDPFMGAGGTVIQAYKAKRRVIGIELEERWCEKAAKRLEFIAGI